MKKNILKFMVPCALFTIVALSSFRSSENFNKPQMDLETVQLKDLGNDLNFNSSFLRIAVTTQTINTEYNKVNVNSAVSAGSVLEYNSKVESVLAKY